MVTAPVAGAPVEGEAPVDARHGGLVRRLGNHSGWLVLVPALALLLAGAVAAALGNTGVRDGCWLVAGLIGLASSTVAVVRGLAHRSGGVDILALLAVAGAIWTGEYLAGALIAVMVGTGSVLDQWAESAAHRELSLLVARSPRVAHRITDETMLDIGVDDVLVGDLLHVGSGEIVPVDARLLESGTFDESALTGEAQAVERVAGDTVRSGVVNAGPPVRIVATSLAAESTYADVVRLVESAQADSSPYVRFADRLAWWFVPATLALAGVAWLASGDPDRVVAVLVVATPCPLLLAVPVAIISGVSQAARRGVVIKGGQVLEQLAAGRVLLFDKTGTLTVGRPTLASVHTAPGIEVTDLLAAAASLDQASPHVLASAIVRAAQDRDLPLAIPTDVVRRSTATASRGSSTVDRYASARPPGSSASTPRPGPDGPARRPTSKDASASWSPSTDNPPGRCCSPTRSARTRPGCCAACGRPGSRAWSWSPATARTSPSPWAAWSASTRSAPSRPRQTRSSSWARNRPTAR